MIIKILRTFLLLSCSLFPLLAFSQGNVTDVKLEKKATVAELVVLNGEKTENIKPQVGLEQYIANSSPEVGKHVMANMDAGSMILSLLMVLALIIICAFVLKRFNFTQQDVSQLRVITSLSLGAKERVIVVQMGEQQLLLGVTGQQITLLDKLAEPLVEPAMKAAELPKNLLSFLSTKKL